MNPNEHWYGQQGPKSWGTGVVGATAGSWEALPEQSWLSALESRRPGTRRPAYTESRNNTSPAGTGPRESSRATDCSLMTNFHLQGSPRFSFRQLENLGREVSEHNLLPPEPSWFSSQHKGWLVRDRWIKPHCLQDSHGRTCLSCLVFPLGTQQAKPYHPRRSQDSCLLQRAAASKGSELSFGFFSPSCLVKLCQDPDIPSRLSKKCML